jgi:hypothetical protein
MKDPTESSEEVEGKKGFRNGMKRDFYIYIYTIPCKSPHRRVADGVRTPAVKLMRHIVRQRGKCGKEEPELVRKKF